MVSKHNTLIRDVYNHIIVMSRFEKLYNSKYIFNLIYCINIIFEELRTSKADEFPLVDGEINKRSLDMNQLTK